MVEVLDRSPRSFDKRLILVKRFMGDLSSGNVSSSILLFGFVCLTFPSKV